MCGICGFTGKEDKRTLNRMTDALIHRGPDEDGYLSDGKINFGIRRLSIIDVATGHQPIHNEDKTIWVVFNGEIYNCAQLRKDLEGRGHRFYTDHSDTEVIVHLYEEYGLEFMHKINGMFAIAIWDKPKELLLLIRDRMGVKPVYYCLVGETLIFASEIKAILTHPSYHPEINYEAVYHYFTFKSVPSPLTAFKDIYALPPASALIFSNKKVKISRWWKLTFRENRECDEAFVKKEILHLLEDATKLRMISDVPFGAYLSGGVDSSAIVALMTRFTNRPVRTFTLGYEDELKNKEADLFFARKVSRDFHTDHNEYIMSCKELESEVQNVITSFDQPFSGTISTYFLTKLISRHVKVALSGDAADELFGSYLSHRVSQPIFHYSRLHGKISGGNLSEAEKNLLKPCEVSYLRDLFNKSDGNEIKWRYLLYLFSDNDKNELLSEKFKINLKGALTFDLVSAYYSNLTAQGPLNRVLEMEWNTQLPDQVLAFVDFLSMAHSVEIRSPFLDYRLVEFCATIPDSMKIKDGIVKHILKQAVKDILPEGITLRPKEGFVLPIFDWMTDKLRNYSRYVLAKKKLGRHGFFNQDGVNSLLNASELGDKGARAKVWNLMMFQVWWEVYFG